MKKLSKVSSEYINNRIVEVFKENSKERPFTDNELPQIQELINTKLREPNNVLNSDYIFEVDLKNTEEGLKVSIKFKSAWVKIY